MSSPGVHISLRIDGLDDVLADFDRFGAEAHEAAETVLGTMWDDFDRFLTGGVVLAPGAGAWAVDTGRSVKGWTPRIRGFRFDAINFIDYAPYVRKASKVPKHKGGANMPLAQDLAEIKFRQLAPEAADDIAEALAAILERG